MRKLIGAAVVLAAFAISTAAWAQPATSGSTGSHHTAPVSAEHVAVHASMTEQMRVMAADGRMLADPMWSEMRDSAHISAEEHLHQGLDRMLAR